MKLAKRSTAAALVLLFSVIVNCNKDPLLTELETKKLIVVLKGTYESNSPAPWSMPALNTPEYYANMQDDSVYECNTTLDTQPTVFMVDLAEIRLWDTHRSYKFSNYRQTYASSLSDINPMFNGAGYILMNDDVPSKVYSSIALYFRKMLFDGAKSYVAGGNGWSQSLVWDVFKEAEYPAYNFNTHQIHSFFDTLRIESTSTNRVYPLIIPINDLLTGGTGMIFDNNFMYTVLEVRLVVKNYIKKYEQRSNGTSNLKVIHFHAFSDWLNDVEKDDTVIGGNVIAVARSYIPQLVGRISGTATAGRHVIAIPAGSDIRAYTLNVDPYTNSFTETNGTLRSLNPCNLPKKPTIYTGIDIYRALDYFLKYENYKIKWNSKVPEGTIEGTTTRCDSYKTFTSEWNKYASEAGLLKFKVPQLAVYTPPTGDFTIENVMPGNYDVYQATRIPTYGKLYYDGEFTQCGTTVTVTTGSAAVITCP